MLSSAAALTAALLLPAALAQNSTASTASGATAASGTATTFPAPTVTGTACGTGQQNLNQCITKVSKDINNCASTNNVCLCQTYANLAACYNGCPDVPDGATWKAQSQQYCTTANISDTGSVTSSNSTTTTTTTIPVSSTPASNATTTTTNTPGTVSKTNTTSSTAPATTAGSFARNSAHRGLEISASLVMLVAGACAIVFA